MHNKQVLSDDNLLIQFSDFITEYNKMKSKHELLWKGFFKQWQRSGRMKHGFSTRVSSIDCKDLTSALEQLDLLYKTNKIKSNPLLSQYLVTKHRMLVEEHNLVSKYAFLTNLHDVINSMIDLYNNNLIDEDILQRIIAKA